MKIIKFIPIITAVMSLLISGCGKKDTQQTATPKVAVQIAPVERTDITIERTYSGTLEGARQSQIYAVIPERVVEIPVSEGQYIKKGDPIIKLDKSGVNSRYNQAFAAYQHAKDNFEKMERLYQQQAISEMDYKSAKTAFEVADADFIAAKGAVELSSPIDGIVTDISVNLGQQAPMGVPIATVAATQKMRMTIYVVAAEINLLKVGQEAKVRIDSGDSVTARITELASSADPETRLFRVELEIDNPGGALKPGMFARAQIVIMHLHQVLAVDNNAVFFDEGISKVYIVQNDTAFARSIELGPGDGRRTQVLSGLEQGQMVVIRGKNNLRDRTPVTISGQEQ
ncbi:MAG: efflux RND transporter periplasmic adaptor subunit [candidate division Zixibacteria bacterium]|jgi:RND family efflux transporter MFP subunit|nr:efflux RND transporter periplasmic adaptor subunit [candidate division Zixibacteria bacterium]